MEISRWRPGGMHDIGVSEAQQVVLSLWERARGAKLFPDRAAFDLRSLKKALGAIAVLDVLREELPSALSYRIRLWGTRLVEWTATEATGRVLAREDGPRAILRRLDSVVASGAPLFAPGVPVPWSPYDYKRFSVLVLPTGAAPPQVTQILCVFEPLGKLL